jgi:hypothetical protein
MGRAAVVGGCALQDLHVVNDSAMSHNLQLEGGSTGTGLLATGPTKTVSYGVFGRTEQRGASSRATRRPA